MYLIICYPGTRSIPVDVDYTMMHPLSTGDTPGDDDDQFDGAGMEMPEDTLMVRVNNCTVFMITLCMVLYYVYMYIHVTIVVYIHMYYGCTVLCTCTCMCIIIMGKRVQCNTYLH